MLLPRVRLQRAAWIALLAMLMAALAPAMSQLLQRGSSTAWVEICRAGGGTAWVAVGDLQTNQTPSKGQPHLLDHCPYCSLQAHALPHVPALLSVFAAPLPDFREPAAFLHAPHTAHAWRPAQSRAPPSRA